MNQLIFDGNLTKDPEMRQSAEGTLVARFTIANNEYRNGQQKTQYIPFVAFGKTAEHIQKYFKKGSAILVLSKVENDNYQNAEGKDVYGYRFPVNSVEFPAKSGGQATTQAQPTPVQPTMQAPVQPMQAPVMQATVQPMAQPTPAQPMMQTPVQPMQAPQAPAQPMAQPAPVPQPQPATPTFMNIPDGVEDQLPFN